MKVSELFEKFNIKNYPALSQDFSIYSHSAVKGYFLLALENFLCSNEASEDGTPNYFHTTYSFSDLIGIFSSLVLVVERFTPEEAEARYFVFNCWNESDV